MPGKYNEQKLNSLIFEAIIPKGLRPESQSDIEVMLDVTGGEKFTEDKLQRMLGKVRGEEPIGFCDWKSLDSLEKLTERQQELVVFYRSRGRELPQEVKSKLDEIRRRAQESKDKHKDGK